MTAACARHTRYFDFNFVFGFWSGEMIFCANCAGTLPSPSGLDQSCASEPTLTRDTVPKFFQGLSMRRS